MTTAELVTTAAIAIAGITFLKKSHPVYVRRRRTFAELHQEFRDDVLGLEQQIREATHMSQLMDIDFKIMMFGFDHRNKISKKELSSAVSLLERTLHNRMTELENQPGLYAI